MISKISGKQIFQQEKRLQSIHIIKADGLFEADLFSESDAYFICRIGSLGSSWAQKALESDCLQFTSKIIHNKNNPDWNASFCFDLSEEWVQLASVTNEDGREGLELELMFYDNDNHIMLKTYV